MKIDAIVAPVWAAPEDDDVRAVVADALLEAGSSWGETLTKRHRDLIGGPIAKIASTTNAAKAPHWATVRTVAVSILTVPQWWLGQWMKNPATKSLREINISNMFLERESAKKPWRVTKATNGTFYGKYLAAFASGLSPDDQVRLEYGPKIRAGVREKLEEAMVEAGVKRR